MPTPTDRGSNSRGLPSAELAAQRYDAGRRMLDDAVAMLLTPVAQDWKGAGHSGQLPTVLLPTPRGSEGAKGGPTQRGSSGDLTLTSSVMLLPTPTASTGGAGDRDGGMRLATLAAVDRWAQYGPAIRRWETILGRPAPEPTVLGKRGGRRLSARFVEWLLGWPDGWVTDLVDNTPALRLCGNGVVRQQGAVALRLLVTAH